MSWLRLAEIAQMARGRLSGADAGVESITTDTRAMSAGQLFVALSGERFDGHDYVAHAESARAAGVMVARPVDSCLPQIVVDDTLSALQRLASAWRTRLQLPLVGLTGSNGKTTVKEMIAAILGRAGEVLATKGNLNNHVGVPLTLLSIRRRHAYGVVEMGANHAGEIAALAAMARPDIALVTNAAAAHLEGFGSVDGVARAKGEIFQGLHEGGCAIINADDRYADYWRGLAGKHQRISFGLERAADVHALRLVGPRWRLITPLGEVEVQLALPGRHNVRNALAATAAGLAAGIDLDSVKAGLEAVTQVQGRLVMRGARYGARLLDDTYNANPGSFAAALEVLAGHSGERWLVLGDMAELGADGEALHRQAGELARAFGVTRLYALGALSRAAAAAFGTRAQTFESHAELAGTLLRDLGGEAPAGVNILVKGSRSMRMEKVVEALIAESAPERTAAERDHAA
jgi:UDP-N-acetylmuramoyl-tripeptide--D-alanyl-D-alanine ligase